MSSEIRVNKINNRSGLSTVTFTNSGPIISGVTTFQDRVDFESNGLNITSGSLFVTGSTSDDLVRITQTGSGNALVVEDTTNPDPTPFVITTSGDVGIKTANPSAGLEVRGTADAPTLTWNGSGQTIIGDLTNQLSIGRLNSSPFSLYLQGRSSNNAARDILLNPAGGDVGIGTDNPQTRLHIDSNTNAQSRITISKSGFLRNNFIGIDGDADELVIAADESNEGPGSHIRFKVDGTEELRIDSNGLKFNGDTAAANALDDYEQGTITTWRLKKSDANTNGSNHSDTHIRYTKIGQCVYVSGYLRTDSTEGAKTGNALLVTVADATVAATLPFTPNHSGGIPIIHTRTINDLDNAISLAFVKDSATIYIYCNNSTGDYVADSNTLSTNTQTNIVITFSGHFFTDS